MDLAVSIPWKNPRSVAQARPEAGIMEISGVGALSMKLVAAATFSR
jgi:hypothetical protein